MKTASEEAGKAEQKTGTAHDAVPVDVRLAGFEPVTFRVGV